MTIRRLLWAAIAVLGLCALLLAALVAWFALRTGTPSVQLVVVDAQGQLQLVALDAGDAPRVLARDVAASGYLYPAVAPDGRTLAYITSNADAHTLVRLDLGTGETVDLYRSSTGQPIDLAWSPDGRYLLWLALDGDAFRVRLLPADGSDQPQSVARGRQTFFAWTDDSSALTIHVDGHALDGGRVEIYRPGAASATPILDDPGLFQAPAWSRDGQYLFYVAQPPIERSRPTIDDIQSDIVRVTADGGQPQVLISEPQADLRIVRSPTSNQLAYLVRKPSADGGIAWGPLKLVDGDDGAARILSSDDQQVVAFFWSPDGRKIAFLSYEGAYTPDGERRWHVVELDSGEVASFEAFTPSRPFAELQIFFDAYIHSFSPWSPDSRRLAYGAQDGVYVLDLDSGQAQRAADGTLGLWVAGR